MQPSQPYLDLVCPQVSMALSDSIPIRVQLVNNSVENYEVISITIFKAVHRRSPIIQYLIDGETTTILVTVENVTQFWFQNMGQKRTKKTKI